MNGAPSAIALTSLDAALGILLEGLAPVSPVSMPLEQTLGRVAAEMPALPEAHPVRDIAVMDGWACRALDLVGASTYSPLVLASVPICVETGDAMPDGYDCVLESDLIDYTGPLVQALGEAAPGEGVRRAGEDLTVGRPLVLEGRRLSAADLLVARVAGKSELAVRLPRVRLVDVGSATGETFTTLLVAECVRTSGAMLATVVAPGRDAASISAALDGEACDLIILVGGTGDGRADATAEALATRGGLLAHRIAVRPGARTALGRLGSMSVVALPGLPDQALGSFLTLVQPVLDRLSGFSGPSCITLPLSRKISSTVGLSEIALLRRKQELWVPLAVGDFSLDAIRLAEAWLAVPQGSEGYGAGTPVAPVPLRTWC